jgi:hypothetical protein
MNNVGISLVPNNVGVLTFNLLNGSFDLDTRVYGAFAVATGCGSGKTTIIKQLISAKWPEGVIYAAFTREEVNAMYAWIRDNLIDRSYLNGHLLTKDDVIVLHSDSTAPGVDNDLWQNHPDKVMKKRIILCTQHKLINESLKLLVGTTYSDNLLFSPVYAAICGMGEHNCFRQWILIDEVLEPAGNRIGINKGLLCGLGEYTNIAHEIVTDTTTNTIKCISKDVGYHFERSLNVYSEFKKKLLAVLEASDPNHLLLRLNNRLNRAKADGIISELYDNYSKYANSGLDGHPVNVSYGIHSLAMDNIRTHVLMFDGTSDITMTSSRKFKVITYPDKYNSKVSIYRLPFNLRRRYDLNLGKDDTMNDLDKIIHDKIDYFMPGLVNFINSNDKTLIFTWKGFKNPSEEINDEEDLPGDDKEIKSVTVTGNDRFDYIGYIKKLLKDNGVSDDKYSIEYYGSGKDKATNEYRDYDAVVLLGKYQVPISVIYAINLDYDANITMTEYYSNRVVQAICRTRIRNHRGEPISVCFTTDWDEKVINYVSNYLGSGTGLESLTSYSEDYMSDMLKSKGITPKLSEKIARLSTINSNIYSAIMTDRQYSTTMSLDDIFKVLPKSRKECDKYASLISKLRVYGINIDIISRVTH